MWDLIVSVPDHCLSFYFEFEKMLAFYFKSAVVVDFCFDLNICCLLVFRR